MIIAGECKPLFGKIFPEREFVLAEGFTEINAKNAVLIVGRTAEVKISAALGIIAEGDDFRDFPRGIQLLTCGASHKNTVSITSRTDEKITLSLNRAIRAKSGIIEPLEYPVDWVRGFSEFDYMAAFAACLLTE